eukprot:1035637-Karenia_brevis.AAC.1
MQQGTSQLAHTCIPAHAGLYKLAVDKTDAAGLIAARTYIYLHMQGYISSLWTKQMQQGISQLAHKYIRTCRAV